MPTAARMSHKACHASSQEVVWSQSLYACAHVHPTQPEPPGAKLTTIMENVVSRDCSQAFDLSSNLGALIHRIRMFKPTRLPKSRNAKLAVAGARGGDNIEKQSLHARESYVCLNVVLEQRSATIRKTDNTNRGVPDGIQRAGRSKSHHKNIKEAGSIATRTLQAIAGAKSLVFETLSACLPAGFGSCDTEEGS